MARASPRRCATRPTRLGRARASERGAFPLFNADLYLAAARFASRLPATLKARAIRASTACATRTCCRSRPPAPSAWPSPTTPQQRHRAAFSWTYTRKKRMPDGSFKEYAVEDHAWRLYRHLGATTRTLPGLRHRAGDERAGSHARWSRRWRPSSTPRSARPSTCRPTTPYADFQDLYLQAWKAGLKGLATYRPNSVLGSVLSVTPARSARRTLDCRRRQPPPGARTPAGAGAGQPALARPARAAGRQPGLDLHDPAPASATSRSSSAARRGGRKARARSRSGSTAPSSRAAWARWPRRCRWTCAPTTRLAAS
jgi:hypothetical protein